jgi:acetyltransferase
VSILLASISGNAATKACQAIADAAVTTDKPVNVVWSGRRSKSEAACALLEAANVPFITTPVRMVRAAAALANFAMDRRRLLPRAAPPPLQPASLTLTGGAVTLSEVESKAVLGAFGIPMTREVLVPLGSDPVAATADLKWPRAVKIVSRDIAHKTEAGGVRLGIDTPDKLKTAAQEIVASAKAYKPDAKVDGILVSEMAQGVEALIGVVNDEGFGPSVTFGLGGIFSEALKDVTFRIAPFGIETAREMIGELRGAKLFDGYRGAPPADKEALARMLVDVSRMAMTLGPRLKEMDINPVFVGADGAVAADALLVLK